MLVTLGNMHFSQMKITLAKIDPHQAHRNLYTKFHGLLNKLGIRCTLSESQIDKGIFGPRTETEDWQILCSPKYFYRAEAAIDLTSEIIDILDLKQELPKNDLGIARLVASAFERLTLVKDPLTQNILDSDLEEIGNLIITASLRSKTIKDPVKIDVKKVESLIPRVNTFFDNLSNITIPEEYLLREDHELDAETIAAGFTPSELSVDGPICQNISRLLSTLTQSLIQKGPVEDLLNDLLENIKHLRNIIFLALPEENEILQELNGIIEDLSRLLD